MRSASPTSALWLEQSLRNIQTLRLAQALMESSYEVRLEDSHGQLAHLSRYFPLRYSTARAGAPALPEIEIVHAQPRTRIGALERPLIFPHAIFDRCRAGWPTTRTVEFFFAGLMTPEREQALRAWSASSGLAIEVPRPARGLGQWLRRRLRHLLAPPIRKCESQRVVFWSSARGRAYPVKAWDEEYFQAMSRAQFVLCPNGDYVWTYRFFEAALCGTIPVVEAACPAYEGFQFFTLSQPLAELRRTEEMAEHNFQLCRQRLTIPRQQLDEEIARLLHQPESAGS